MNVSAGHSNALADTRRPARQHHHPSRSKSVHPSPLPRFARHASPLTNIIYTHTTDEDLRAGIRWLPVLAPLAIWLPEGPKGASAAAQN